MHGEGGQGGEQRVLPPAPVQEGRHTLLRSAIHHLFLDDSQNCCETAAKFLAEQRGISTLHADVATWPQYPVQPSLYSRHK